MTNAHIFKVENRLARVVRQPGGRTIREAVLAAEAKIETLRDRCLAGMAERAAELAAAAQAVSRAPGEADFDSLYRLSDAIYGVAGTFELKALAAAASSLCDLIEGFRSGLPANWPAVDVHVDGIRLLAGDDAGADVILAGLHRVRDRFVAS